MNQLKTTSPQLPALPEDLAKFILVGREKLQSVRAEIRAIDKLHLAEEVRAQKRDEARMLSEALLDAEVRIGELFKLMPTAQGARTDIQPRFTAEPKLMTKQEATASLGFDSNQVKRFETLASHPDLVEQVKADARENDDLPTRTAVLNLVKYKEEKARAEDRQIDEDYRLSNLLDAAVAAVIKLPTDRDSVEAMRRGAPFAIVEVRDELKRAIEILRTIQFGFERR